jgi:hypothetical protein
MHILAKAGVDTSNNANTRRYLIGAIPPRYMLTIPQELG